MKKKLSYSLFPPSPPPPFSLTLYMDSFDFVWFPLPRNKFATTNTNLTIATRTQAHLSPSKKEFFRSSFLAKHAIPRYAKSRGWVSWVTGFSQVGFGLIGFWGGRVTSYIQIWLILQVGVRSVYLNFVFGQKFLVNFAYWNILCRNFWSDLCSGFSCWISV